MTNSTAKRCYMTRPYARNLFVVGACLLTAPIALSQDKADPPAFEALRGEWQLPTFKDADREYTVRVSFQLEREKHVLKHAWTADGFSDRGTQPVGFSTEKDKPVLQFFGATGKVRATVPYGVKDDILTVEAAFLLKAITRDTIRVQFKDKWEPLLKDAKEWRKVKSEK